MKLQHFLTAATVAMVALSGCSNKDVSPTGTTSNKAVYEAGGEAGKNGTAKNPSGTSKTISAESKLQAQKYVEQGHSAIRTSISSMEDNWDLMFTSFSDADAAFKAAIEFDPNNTEAQFGAAIGAMWNLHFAILEQPTLAELLDTEQQQSLFKNGAVPLGVSKTQVQRPAEILSKIAAIDSAESKKISALQKTVKDSLMPLLVYALDRLSIVEKDPDFSFAFVPEMINGTPVVTYDIDLGEVYMIDAAIRIMRGVMLTLLAYNVDMDDNGSYAWIAEGDSVIAAHAKRLLTSSDFLVLHPWGEEALGSAIVNFRTSIDKIITLAIKYGVLV